MSLDLSSLLAVEGCAAYLRPSAQLQALYIAYNSLLESADRLEKLSDESSAAYLALTEAITIVQLQYRTLHGIETAPWERAAPQYRYCFSH